MSKRHCPRRKQYTESKNPKVYQTTSGCTGKKTIFIKEPVTSRLINSLGLKSLLGKAPVLGHIPF